MIDDFVKMKIWVSRHSGLDPESCNDNNIEIPDQVRNDSVGIFYDAINDLIRQKNRME